MNKNYKFFTKRKTCVVSTIICTLVLHLITRISPAVLLLDSDTLNIYKNNMLIISIENPIELLDPENEGVLPIYIPSNLGISRFMMTELYTLEFSKKGKVISRIRILTPKTTRAITLIDRNSFSQYEWNILHDRYVILRESFEFFTFGQGFFDNLSDML